MHDNDPEVLEREKRKNLSGTQHETSTPHKTYAPGWNEHLASESEAHIKADRAPGTVEELVKTTVEYVKRRHPREGTDESFTLREEVDGPLRSAAGAAEQEDPEPTVGKDKFRAA
ncbi:hypothetical protein AURDEDRAFT_162037 [Auricularia subglabra TFB-10046 SS5]|nr:hypothetical protein AURDEDRAFT_162037 [Auricularia subglabra TFB-10046 SS5]